MEQDMFETMREDDKAVIVAVHEDAVSGIGQQGIDRLTLRLHELYPNYDFREACTNQGQMSQASDPDQLFIQLQKDGYTHVLVQSSSITNDLDMQYLRHLVEAAKGKFKQMRLGEPLLSSLTDYQEVAKMLISHFSMPKQVNVLVCNGSDEESDATYTLLDYILRDQGQDWFLSTINGHPSLAHLIKQLKKQKLKKVHLVPFNAEANKMIGGEWIKMLQQAGYKVTAEPQTLVEQEGIIHLFEQHIHHAEQFRTLTAKEQKLLVH
ncbi:MAG: sirohydrochlorin cobaltochelatase [Bacteroidaceae bacterium]|nr:sirohydrochlorin cobaltochelatase [Bacteroidaceae bacterium]